MLATLKSSHHGCKEKRLLKRSPLQSNDSFGAAANPAAPPVGSAEFDLIRNFEPAPV
jgi:hypothetical protein